MRRTPIRHTVRRHKRGGKWVGSFERGSGIRVQRSRVVGKRVTDDDTPIGVHAFTANFRYSDKPGDGESVIVFSNNYTDAMDEAWEERMDNRTPIAVEIVDPDIGTALKWVGERVRGAIKYGAPKLKTAAHLGAKYTVKATMATGRTAKRVAKAGAGASVELLKLTAFSAQKAIIQNLLKQCYAKDRAQRIAARAALRSRFPEIYDMCDFSRESPRRRRRRVPEVVVLPRSYRKQVV